LGVAVGESVAVAVSVWDGEIAGDGTDGCVVVGVGVSVTAVVVGTGAGVES
jgi:hypothetical protein